VLAFLVFTFGSVLIPLLHNCAAGLPRVTPVSMKLFSPNLCYDHGCRMYPLSCYYRSCSSVVLTVSMLPLLSFAGLQGARACWRSENVSDHCKRACACVHSIGRILAVQIVVVYFFLLCSILKFVLSVCSLLVKACLRCTVDSV
jgi:hypothetical protein